MSVTELKAGYYWVRDRGNPHLMIQEWSPECGLRGLWFAPGIDGGFPPDWIEVCSEKLSEPCPVSSDTRAVHVPVDLIRRLLIGGNHLALVIGHDHPPYTATHDQALEHYIGENHDHDGYEAWCCWRTIMALRDAVNLPC